MPSHYYKVVLNGGFQGQDIKNVLYYRSGPGFDPTSLGFAGAQQVANAVHTKIWTEVMKPIADSGYTLETIDVYTYNDALRLVFQNPYHLPVGEIGAQGSVAAGPAACMNFVFSLEPTVILANGIKPPKRGYLAFGPINRDWMDESGYITNSVYSNAEHPIWAFANRLGSDIFSPFETSFILWPIRMKANRTILDELMQFETFADINGCTISRRLSYRRSRLAE